jgi:hypothetical protein
MERTGGISAILHVVASLAELYELVTHHADHLHTENRTVAEKIIQSLGFDEPDLTSFQGLDRKLERTRTHCRRQAKHSTWTKNPIHNVAAVFVLSGGANSSSAQKENARARRSFTEDMVRGPGEKVGGDCVESFE